LFHQQTRNPGQFLAPSANRSHRLAAARRSTLRKTHVERVATAMRPTLPTNDYGLCGERAAAGEVLVEAAGGGGGGVALMDCSVSKRFLRLVAS